MLHSEPAVDARGFSIAAATRVPRHSDWGPAHGAYGDRIVQVSDSSMFSYICIRKPFFFKIYMYFGVIVCSTQHVSCSDIVPRTCANFKVDAHLFSLLLYQSCPRLFALVRLDERLAIAN